ncbi:unnamed protein product [Ectocarpus sp. CCAP 1310/34]|nr:unnamed protein product [Ectocarpus sp. CCAP 1310/34]
MRTRLADRLGSEREMKKLVPVCAGLVACSFDNVNLDVNRHFGGSSHVDLVAAIAYHHTSASRRQRAELPQRPPKLNFVRDFGTSEPRMVLTWERFRAQVLACVQERAVEEDGDFEVRLARRVIRDAAPEERVGVEGRRIPEEVTTKYLGVIDVTTKVVKDIVTFLDGLQHVIHIGAEGGRGRAVVAGDQETFTLVHKAKKQFGAKYDWVLPWIGDWHLLEHTLDVLFRKWGGGCIIPLAKAADAYTKKLESKNYHKRYFAFRRILEALWGACVGEIKSQHSTDGPVGAEELLGRLVQYRGSTKHKTFGQWAELLLDDGMAYLAVYISIRVGDFDLREAAIRQIAPLFLGYKKKLYHALTIQHLADIVNLRPSEREFLRGMFSLSLAGNPGKNVGLDEIQEMTMNKEIKQAAHGTDVSIGVYERKLHASHHRTILVKKVFDMLTAAGSPIKLTDEKGRLSCVIDVTTKVVKDIVTFLDGLQHVIHIGAEGGRARAVVAGDQETFTLVHKAEKQFGAKYDWVLPWIGDWHLLEHTLDVLFRKWGGFCVIPLTKAADAYTKKLESKNYHKRHFAFTGILEALWRACVGEIKSQHSTDGPMGAEELLGRLVQYRGSTKHKTFGQWAELLLDDGMAYLAVYISIRVGDFDLREAAIRQIAPLFLDYNKNLYHALTIQHLADIANLRPSEREFLRGMFSLSLAGNPGKNVGLDEIQEMTMNKEIKQAAHGTDVRYLQRLALTLQTMNNAARAWKESFGSIGVYERKLHASHHRTILVKKVFDILTAAGSPIKLTDEKGRLSVISADGGIALPHLEKRMLRARETLTSMIRPWSWRSLLPDS